MNTIPPADYTYFEFLNEVIQAQPAGAVDAEIAGQCAAIGIVKGKAFSPDARMKKILTERGRRSNAASRANTFNPRTGRLQLLRPDSNWVNRCSPAAMNS